MDKGVILVYSTHDAFQLEKHFQQKQIPVKMVPPPRHLSSDCGFCLEFNWGDEKKITKEINILNLEIQGIHKL